MKNVFLVIFVLVLSIMFISCSQDDDLETLYRVKSMARMFVMSDYERWWGLEDIEVQLDVERKNKEYQVTGVVEGTDCRSGRKCIDDFYLIYEVDKDGEITLTEDGTGAPIYVD